MALIINPGTPADLPAINSIYNHYVKESNVTFDIEPWGEQKRLEWFEQFEANADIYSLLVATLDDQLVGFAYNSKYKEKAAYATSSEVTVYVKTGLQGQGIGAQLYRELLARISLTPLHRLYAGITLPNDGSIRLHKKFGFKLAGTLREVGYKHSQFHSVALLEKFI
ncbi:MAG: N-acetyltransferase family protein [Pseudomonadales bacterium]|nr:N-acetyltransferase family protein [Pseudomonadales bacterium]NRA17113.1 N-acetyltransferase family protein [Oceanospirillaceae bacterium]